MKYISNTPIKYHEKTEYSFIVCARGTKQKFLLKTIKNQKNTKKKKPSKFETSCFHMIMLYWCAVLCYTAPCCAYMRSVNQAN